VFLFAHEGQQDFEGRQDVVGRGDTQQKEYFSIASIFN
jgi:hypothetical protein